MKEGLPMKKVLAIILALVMVLGAIPFFVLADEDTATASAADTVAAWNEKLAPVLAELYDNDESAHLKYVAENNDELQKTMTAYTVFALYDNAWKNGFDKSISVEDAEKILVSLIEKVDTNIGDSKFKEIFAVLQTASDLNDLLQKVNSYVNISDVLTSDEWSTTFKYIKKAIEFYHLYEKQRDAVIEAYARILSVQASNQYYKDMLRYCAANSEYDVVVTACNNLITDIETSVDELIKAEIKNRIGYTSSELFTSLAELALNTNSYTAVALKVYNIGTSVADKLWNTSDQYALMDELYTSYYLETAVVDWAKEAQAAGDAEKFVFGTGAVLGLRQVGAQTLYDLKVAQNGGIVGKVKNQINLNVGFENVSEMAFLTLAEEALFNTAIADLQPINSIVITATNAYIGFDGYRLYNSDATITNNGNFYYIKYSDAIANYVKAAFLTSANASVELKSSTDYNATLILKKLENNEIVNYSFTDVTIGENAKVTFNSADATYTYLTGEDEKVVDFNTEFQYPSINAVTAKSVATAVGNVVKTEATQKVEEVKGKVVTIDALIREFFAKIAAAFEALFKVNS
jgi:hypothetical protein